jgi:hypothetical protein
MLDDAGGAVRAGSRNRAVVLAAAASEARFELDSGPAGARMIRYVA